MSKRQVAGFRIAASKPRIMSSLTFSGSNDPASITLHRLGGESAWLTPDEARQLAAALTGAAEEADGKTP